MKKRVALIFGALSAFLILGCFAAEPGTEGDPLVTKSYIESVVYPNMKFNLVNVPAGKSVICSSGTEIVLRMGTCSIIGTAKGGLGDVTMGFDLANGTTVQGNHLLLVPTDDGRGVYTSTDCILMIKGSYTIN